MADKNPYPNSWYVMRQMSIGTDLVRWYAVLDSVGNKSYATGYLSALESFMPHPAYQLIDNHGRVAQEIQPRGGVQLN